MLVGRHACVETVVRSKEVSRTGLHPEAGLKKAKSSCRFSRPRVPFMLPRKMNSELFERVKTLESP